MHLGPSRRAPNNTKIAVRDIAVLYFIVPVATPVPKIFAESLAPRLQPRRTLLKIFHISYYILRPLQNAPFCPISASGSNFKPRNTQCIPTFKIFAFLEFEQN
jgi:hypothetical protein